MASQVLAPAAAEALVAEQRRLAAADGKHRRVLADALLELSRAYEHADRSSEAVAVARESVATLASDFLAKPRAFAEPIRAALAQYVALCRRSGAVVDEAMLAPIAQALGDLVRAEDREDDGG